MPFLQQLHFVISSWYWLVFILACFIGLLAWLTYMALTQRQLMKQVVKREDLPEIFAQFKRDLASGK